MPEPQWVLRAGGPVVPGSGGLVEFGVTAEVTLPPGLYQDAQSPFLRLEPQGPFKVLEKTASPPRDRAGHPSYTGTFTLHLRLEGPPTGPVQLEAGWQICQTDGACYLPGRRVLTLEGPPPPVSADPWAWAAALGAAFLGGLVLNLMPCVFPVVALKALGLVRNADLGRRRAELLASAAGGLGVLGALGLVTAGAAAWGQRLDWGFTFQQPAFTGALMLVFWVFGLQLGGLWSWPGSPWAIGATTSPWGPPGRAAGLGRSAAAGAFLVAAAAPCTAPFLGPALGFAFTLPPAQIPWFFLAAGLGLTAPFLVLAAFPGAAGLFPRPGPWTRWAEGVAGVLLGLTALWLASVLLAQVGVERFWAVALVLGTTAAFLSLGNLRSPLWRRGLRAVGGLVLLGSAWVAAAPGDELRALGPRVPEAAWAAQGWGAYSPGALEKALAQGRTVFIDGTAAWCLTCQVNEAGILASPRVRELWKASGTVLLRADATTVAPEVTAWLATVGRAGLPVYALYRPGKAPILYPELLTEQNFTVPLTRDLSLP